jgi:CRISPR-associated protein Cmr5
MQQNLEQLRAAHALQNVGTLDKRAISKLPAMILSNGLLAATAFSLDGGGDNRRDMKEAMNKVALHLRARELTGPSVTDGKSLVTDLANRGSADLQQATNEALRYLAYLKRFAVKGED